MNFKFDKKSISLAFGSVCLIVMLSGFGCEKKSNIQKKITTAVAAKKTEKKAKKAAKDKQEVPKGLLLKVHNPEVAALRKQVTENPHSLVAKFAYASGCKKYGLYKEAADAFKVCYVFSTNMSQHEKELCQKARYQAINCAAKAIFTADIKTDQSALDHVMKSCDAYLANKELNPVKVDRIAKIKESCKKRTFKKLEDNFNDYLTRNNFAAADSLLKIAQEKYGKTNDAVPQLACMEVSLSVNKGLSSPKKDLTAALNQYEKVKANYGSSSAFRKLESSLGKYLPDSEQGLSV